MSVIITNVSSNFGTDGEQDYIVRINDQPPIAAFRHVRANGLAECLRAAADAVEAKSKPQPTNLTGNEE